MKITMHVKSDFPAVFFINGMFFEKADRVDIRRDEVAYLTVLPLSAAFLPYTLKLVGGKPTNNDGLCRTIELTKNDLLLILSPRYNYVYTAQSPASAFEIGSPELVPAFFRAVAHGEIQTAKNYLTPDLTATLSDGTLTEFFSDYTDIIANDGFVPSPPSSYFLIDKSGKSTLFTFVIKNGLIDDITEK